MKEFKYVITDAEGIHARPATMLVKKAAGFKSDINIASSLEFLHRVGHIKSNSTRFGVGHQPGDIILLHDIYKTSVQAAFIVIDELQRQGYEFVTVEELLFA